jgi:mRNA interferase RelE/StbE
MADGKFQVKMTDAAFDQYKALPRTIRARVMKIFERLADWPRVSGAKPLRGNLAGRYRIRTGDYRMQFGVQDRLVIVEKIGHRDGFYED